MTDDWLERVKQRLKTEAAQKSTRAFDRLKAMGMINDRGEVTGHLHRWDADLAITEVRRSPGSPQVDVFHCLKPVFGIPGGTPVDVPRDAMVNFLKAGKKVITARHDDRLDLWIEGDDVHLTPSGFVQSNGADDLQDNVGTDSTD